MKLKELLSVINNPVYITLFYEKDLLFECKSDSKALKFYNDSVVKKLCFSQSLVDHRIIITIGE